MTDIATPSPRESYESHHAQWLANYAVAEADCGGRRFPEQAHHYRTCFQRDRDRILHCHAFRRLDFKTQVFVPHEHDHYRTRLTHTLEVAQIARSLGRTLRLNEDLIEPVALAHDLGHPPFGHAGEAALDKLMAEHGGFEHNRQSLRVVDYLEHPYDRFPGLNLTHAVRECLARHETAYDTPACEDFGPGALAPMEGQLVDLADEIAYTSADLEDSLAAGLITTSGLENLSLWRRASAATEDAAPASGPIHTRIRTCKAVLVAMADDLIQTTTNNISALEIACVADVRAAPRRCVAFSDHMAVEVKELQGFLLKEVYLAGENARQDRLCRRIISDLFWAYLAKADLLPNDYRRRIDGDGLPRTACDYIAGMTDRFCKAEHARIHG